MHAHYLGHQKQVLLSSPFPSLEEGDSKTESHSLRLVNVRARLQINILILFQSPHPFYEAQLSLGDRVTKGAMPMSWG